MKSFWYERQQWIKLIDGLSFFLFLHMWCSLIHRDTKPMPLIHCQTLNKSPSDSLHTHDHRSEARLRIDPKVLVFVETTYSKLGREIAEELVYNRIKWVLLSKDVEGLLLVVILVKGRKLDFNVEMKRRFLVWWWDSSGFVIKLLKLTLFSYTLTFLAVLSMFYVGILNESSKIDNAVMIKSVLKSFNFPSHRSSLRVGVDVRENPLNAVK